MLNTFINEINNDNTLSIKDKDRCINFIKQLDNTFKPLSYSMLQVMFNIKCRNTISKLKKYLLDKGYIQELLGNTYSKGGKITGSQPNSYRLGSADQIIVCSVVEDNTPTISKTIKFSYKGIRDVEETISVQDTRIAKQVFDDEVEETLFTNRCMSLGMSREKAWFLYDKLTIKKMTNELFK